MSHRSQDQSTEDDEEGLNLEGRDRLGPETVVLRNEEKLVLKYKMYGHFFLFGRET